MRQGHTLPCCQQVLINFLLAASLSSPQCPGERGMFTVFLTACVEIYFCLCICVKFVCVCAWVLLCLHMCLCVGGWVFVRAWSLACVCVWAHVLEVSVLSLEKQAVLEVFFIPPVEQYFETQQTRLTCTQKQHKIKNNNDNQNCTDQRIESDQRNFSPPHISKHRSVRWALTSYRKS